MATTIVVFPISYDVAVRTDRNQYGDIHFEFNPADLSLLQRETLLSRPRFDTYEAVRVLKSLYNEEELYPPLSAATLDELKRALTFFAEQVALTTAKETAAALRLDTVMTENVENLILEHLRAMRADIVEIKRDMHDVKIRLSTLELRDA